MKSDFITYQPIRSKPDRGNATRAKAQRRKGISEPETDNLMNIVDNTKPEDTHLKRTRITKADRTIETDNYTIEKKAVRIFLDLVTPFTMC